MTRRNTPRRRPPRQLGWVAEYELAQEAKRAENFRAAVLGSFMGELPALVDIALSKLTPEQLAALKARVAHRMAPYRTQPTAASMAMPVRIARWPN